MKKGFDDSSPLIFSPFVHSVHFINLPDHAKPHGPNEGNGIRRWQAGQKPQKDL
jgi:hypothetical protein